MRDVEQWKVILFLYQFKKFAQNVFKFVEWDKSRDTIAYLGITPKQAKQEILSKGFSLEKFANGLRTSIETSFTTRKSPSRFAVVMFSKFCLKISHVFVSQSRPLSQTSTISISSAICTQPPI